MDLVDAQAAKENKDVESLSMRTENKNISNNTCIIQEFFNCTGFEARLVVIQEKITFHKTTIANTLVQKILYSSDTSSLVSRFVLITRKIVDTTPRKNRSQSATRRLIRFEIKPTTRPISHD
jgi:hypothetical protein